MNRPASSANAQTAELFSIEHTMAFEGIPSNEQIETWLGAALQDQSRPKPHDPDLCWVAIRIVDEEESQQLNKQWRGIDRPTNVLSFPAMVEGFLGDLVLCAPLIAREATEQGKPIFSHWAHLLVHGALHLCGWDHDTSENAQAMESKEVLILDGLGIINPYIDH